MLNFHSRVYLSWGKIVFQHVFIFYFSFGLGTFVTVIGVTEGLNADCTTDEKLKNVYGL